MFKLLRQRHIVPEYNHPDLKGNKRLDVVGFGPQQKKIDFACEAKWIKDTNGTRDIHGEVADDIFRLECLRTGMAQQTERALIVGGISEPVAREFYGKRKQLGAGAMTPWIDAILPTTCGTSPSVIQVQAANPTFMPFFKCMAAETTTGELPVSYHAMLVTTHVGDPANPESVRCDVWLIRSIPNRRTFVPQ